MFGLPDEAQFGIFAYPMASRKNKSPTAVLRERGHASAFDLFLRWEPRALLVREDTRPYFEVTRQLGSPDATHTVPVPMNRIPLVPPGRP